MLTGIHILLTYQCTSECDHCFLHCSPDAEGTFTFGQLRTVLDEAVTIGTIETIYFEGGEPFLYYPLLVEGIRLARKKGFEVGIVTNCYWATTIEDAELWLKPLHELEISDLYLSDDSFHHDKEEDSPAKIALRAAKKLGMPVNAICIEKPEVVADRMANAVKGKPVIGGGVMFRGRAVEKLTEGLPTRDWKELNSCPHEDLENPERVHVDAFGNVHLCQGLSMGNMWKTPLSKMVKNYNPLTHPICAPLIKGGPAALAEKYGVPHDDAYIDECHLCYLVRRALIDRFPDLLSPKQVYGLK